MGTKGLKFSHSHGSLTLKKQGNIGLYRPSPQAGFEPAAYGFVDQDS